MPARGSAVFRLSREQDGDAGQHQHHADDRKGVAETHHQRLLFDRVAERSPADARSPDRSRHAGV